MTPLDTSFLNQVVAAHLFALSGRGIEAIKGRSTVLLRGARVNGREKGDLSIFVASGDANTVPKVYTLNISELTLLKVTWPVLDTTG
jgi:hypothetical protein